MLTREVFIKLPFFNALAEAQVVAGQGKDVFVIVGILGCNALSCAEVDDLSGRLDIFKHNLHLLDQLVEVQVIPAPSTFISVSETILGVTFT